MTEEQLLNRMHTINAAIKMYEKKKDSKHLVSLMYIDPAYENDLLPGIYEYFKIKFEDLKEEYKTM